MLHVLGFVFWLRGADNGRYLVSLGGSCHLANLETTVFLHLGSQLGFQLLVSDQNLLSKMLFTKPRSGQDFYSFNTTMAACADALKWEATVSLLELMRKMPGVNPDSYSYSAVISACGRALHWPLALSVFDQAERGSMAGPVS